MGRLKLDIEKRRRGAARRLARDVWRCVKAHIVKGHRMRLTVDDDGKVLECLFCDMPVVCGSDDMMDGVCEALVGSGIEFEIECETRRALH